MLCPHCNVSFFEHWTGVHACVWDDEILVAQGYSYVGCPACGKLIMKIVEEPLDPETEDFDRDENDSPTITSEFTVYPNF